MKAAKQRLAGLEQEARPPRLAMEADVPIDINTRKLMEKVSTKRVISGDSSSVQVDTDPMCLISFGDDSIGPRALPSTRDGALVDNGAAAPKPCLSPAEIRTQIAAGGLLPTGTASTAMGTIFPRPFFSWSLGETNKRTSRISNQLTPFWRRVIQTKSRQTLVLDPGGSTSRLRAFPPLGTWRALLFGEVFFWAPGGIRGWSVFSRKRYKRPVHIAVDSCFSAVRLFQITRQSSTIRGYVSCGDKRMTGNTMERGVWWQGTPRSASW